MRKIVAIEHGGWAAANNDPVMMETLGKGMAPAAAPGGQRDHAEGVLIGIYDTEAAGAGENR